MGLTTVLKSARGWDGGRGRREEGKGEWVHMSKYVHGMCISEWLL